MKRQQKPKRDREGEQLKKMTTLSITENEMRERLLADKAALEAKLKELFAFRRALSFPSGTEDASKVQELIRGVSAELRVVKTSLKLVGGI